MTILHPDVAEEELPGEIDKVSGYIAAAGGELAETLKDSPWGRRRLAYPVRHGGRDLRDGFYVVQHFDLAPHQVTEVERELKLNEKVIRYLVTSYVPQPIDPRVIEQQEIDAEDAAAAAYAAAQAEKARAEDEAAEAYAAAQAEKARAEAEAERAVATDDVAAADDAAAAEEQASVEAGDASTEEAAAEAEAEARAEE